MSLESHFDAAFVASQALREKQIQQNYRPVIGVHKWFARRPGTLFRALLLAEFGAGDSLARSFYEAHRFQGIIADPFMGGGTSLVEANRLGFHVVGADINPMAYWVVRQELSELEDSSFLATAKQVAADVGAQLRHFYATRCICCSQPAEAKYFIWVKIQRCPFCDVVNDLFPGYLLAEATRHPKHVLACSDCGVLVELGEQPHRRTPAVCPSCGGRVQVEGPARRSVTTCRGCGIDFRYPNPISGPPQHRLWAIEYYCSRCKSRHSGRFFKAPDDEDLTLIESAAGAYARATELRIPCEEIPEGDETSRLRRWGYRHWRDLFSTRQLLGLGMLQERILQVEDRANRDALLTVFSDILRYQNMLCRYDTYALKCQDIFSVHGFPVGLVQCENNVLGIPGIGSGGFLHFVEKYRRAKAYCRAPFEVLVSGSKRKVPVTGERIAAKCVTTSPTGSNSQAQLMCAPGAGVSLLRDSLDGVFTDPPYFANVQYAELMDFCYVWLRQSLSTEFPEFVPHTTRSSKEVAGNTTDGRGIDHFTEGLSEVFMHYAAALKPGAPFVFTYHHNDPEAYAPLVVALLDAKLLCSVVLPAPGEMEASLHINKTSSSILDSVFVSRRAGTALEPLPTPERFQHEFLDGCRQMLVGGVRMTQGDAQCLMSGHLARLCIHALWMGWDHKRSVRTRLHTVRGTLRSLTEHYNVRDLVVGAVSAKYEPRLKL